MSSILTNNGAMVALQTLKSINGDLSKVQSQISTGKNVASAKDNSAIWAISKVMESDVAGFKGISDSLSLGQSTVSVARQAAETVTDLLTQMKSKIVAAQESNVDRVKIQTDVVSLRNQIQSVVGAAQFNGLNLLQGNDPTQPGSVNILASLDRSGGGVVASDITVNKIDLGTQQGGFTLNFGGATTAVVAASNNVTLNATTSGTATLTAAPTAGSVYTLNIGASSAFGTMTNLKTHTTGTAITVAQAQTYTYIAKDGDTASDISTALVKQFNDAKAEATGTIPLSLSVNGAGAIAATATGTDASDTITVQIATLSNVGDVRIDGGLVDINSYDVTTETGVNDALDSIEGMIQKAIDTAASFGSIEKRIETQAKFVTNLSDALKSGIGTLVDANMEEASARLQALQVQQQLGIQALSIANQAPQSLLSLFRG